MLKSIDQALAGAIDVIADDVQATVKSVREQGMMRTLGDAVEDAGKLVVNGAGSALSGIMTGKKGEKTVSTHSGVSSGYADICAGNKAGSFGGGGAAFPYVPNSGSSRPSTSSKAPVGSFGPGVGIRLPSQMPNAGAPPGILPYAGGAGAGGVGAGAFRPPPPFQPPSAVSAPAPAPTPYSTPGPAVPASAGKEATIPTELLKPRFDAIVGKDAANSKCFDCGAADHEWASVSFGIFLCITCAGHHRQLGTHISRIRSCKMDSWTEKQMQIFNSGGNRRLAEFFQANGVPASSMYQRYSTPAGEWYREAWIKCRTLGRPVPAPPQGVVVGPCIDNQAPQEKKAPAAPAVDLLDVGAEAEKPKATAAAAQTADLLNFDGPVVSNSKETDLLGGGAGAGDLLGLSGGAANQANDLLSLGGGVALDFGAPAKAPVAAFQTSAAPAMLQSPALAMEVPALASTPAPAPAANSPVKPAAAPFGSNTLGGGAKLVEQQQEKADDPFALALKQWNM